MSKAIIAEEVQILRFFETAAIEKAEVVYNIVREKMQERLGGRGTRPESSPKGTDGIRKRPMRASAQQPSGPEHDQDTEPHGA